MFLLNKTSGVTKAVLVKIGYMLYVNTPFGPWFYRNQLVRARQLYPGGHRLPRTIEVGRQICIHVVPYSLDNYAYLVWHRSSSDCVLVDPGHMQPIAAAIDQLGLTPKLALITHKHLDHAGGVADVVREYGNIEVVGPQADGIPHLTRSLRSDGEDIWLHSEAGNPLLQFKSVLTPGHTVGHTVYILTDCTDAAGTGRGGQSGKDHHRAPSAVMEDEVLIPGPCLFTGDAVFLAGIGRTFEGSELQTLTTTQHLILSLMRAATLHSSDSPNQSKPVYLFHGHEYAMRNLLFVLDRVDMDNEAARNKLDEAEMDETMARATVPTSLDEEMSYNPFLRVAWAAMRADTGPGPHQHHTTMNSASKWDVPPLSAMVRSFQTRSSTTRLQQRYLATAQSPDQRGALLLRLILKMKDSYHVRVKHILE